MAAKLSGASEIIAIDLHPRRLQLATELGATEVIEAGEAFGRHDHGAGQRVQVEFVSANPTGPLHIGHGRGAAIGSVIAKLLETSGFDVQREYYVNDAGRQMDILALSVYLRYLQACGRAADLPEQAYQGDYIADIAADLKARHSEAWCREIEFASADDSDSERALDNAIAQVRAAL